MRCSRANLTAFYRNWLQNSSIMVGSDSNRGASSSKRCPMYQPRQLVIPVIHGVLAVCPVRSKARLACFAAITDLSFPGCRSRTMESSGDRLRKRGPVTANGHNEQNSSGNDFDDRSVAHSCEPNIAPI